MKRKVKSFIILLVSMSLSFVACLLILGFGENKNTNVDKHNPTQILYIPVSVNQVKGNVLFKGSVDDYLVLKDLYAGTANPEEILFYSMLMAGKYDYTPANYDVYQALDSFFSRNKLGDFDEETRRLAMQYLKFGAMKGDRAAIKAYDKLNRMKVIKTCEPE